MVFVPVEMALLSLICLFLLTDAEFNQFKEYTVNFSNSAQTYANVINYIRLVFLKFLTKIAKPVIAPNLN